MESLNNEKKADIKLLSSNGKLLQYFNEIIFGNYDDGELHNFLILNKNIKNTFFIVTESNDETSISSFIKNNITSNNIMQNFLSEIKDNINDEDIIFSPTNYSLLVININPTDNGLEINTLGIFEWLLSNIMFKDIIGKIEDSIKLFNIDDFDLYALNYSDISKSFAEILKDENVQEILNAESI